MATNFWTTKKISSLEDELKKAKNTIRIQDMEIIKLKTDVSKMSKNVDDLDKQARIQRKNEKFTDIWTDRE